MHDEQIQKFPVLRSAYGGLTKSERRIADYITAVPERVLAQTISDIASATESSEITVSRFCKKLGFSGLQELKMNLTAELSAAESKQYHDIHSQDDCHTVAVKVFQNLSDGLQDTLSLLDYQAVDEAASILQRARRIAVYGFGNSATVCRDIATRYLRLGFAIQDYADSHMQVTSAALLTDQDAVIAVSHSGASSELIQSVEAAKRSGAKIIVITSHGQSPLAKLADICLCGMGREVKYSSEAGASRMIHMAIGDVLYTRIAMADSDTFQENIQKMRHEILKKRMK